MNQLYHNKVKAIIKKRIEEIDQSLKLSDKKINLIKSILKSINLGPLDYYYYNKFEDLENRLNSILKGKIYSCESIALLKKIANLENINSDLKEETEIRIKNLTVK